MLFDIDVIEETYACGDTDYSYLASRSKVPLEQVPEAVRELMTEYGSQLGWLTYIKIRES